MTNRVQAWDVYVLNIKSLVPPTLLYAIESWHWGEH